MELLLTVIGVAGWVIGVHSWIEHFFKHPGDRQKASEYVGKVTNDREAWQAFLIVFPLILILVGVLIAFFPAIVNAIVGLLFALANRVRWVWDTVRSLRTQETAEALKRADTLFDGADRNRDNVVTLKELKDYADACPWFRDAYKSSSLGTLEDNLEAIFNAADADGNKILTRQELRDYFEGETKRIRRITVEPSQQVLSLRCLFCSRSLSGCCG